MGGKIFKQDIPAYEAIKGDTVWLGRIGGRVDHSCKFYRDINGSLDDDTIYIKQDNWREYYSKWGNIAKECVYFREDFQEKFINKYGHIFKKKVLGVLMREEFTEEYMKMLTNEVRIQALKIHPHNPDCETVVQLIKNKIQEWEDVDYIFVCTQFIETIQLFEKVFGDKVVYIDRERRGMAENEKYYGEMCYDEMTNSEKRVVFERMEKEVQHQFYTYAEEIYGLQQCDYFMGAVCGGTQSLLVLNGGKYKDIYIFPQVVYENEI